MANPQDTRPISRPADANPRITGRRDVTPHRSSCEDMVIDLARQALARYDALDLGAARSTDFHSVATNLAGAVGSLLRIVETLQSVADHMEAAA